MSLRESLFTELALDNLMEESKKATVQQVKQVQAVRPCRVFPGP